MLSQSTQETILKGHKPNNDVFQLIKTQRQPKLQPQISQLLKIDQTIPLSNQRTDNLASPIYRGHFVNFYHYDLGITQQYTISGVQNGFAYLAHGNTIEFYFYSPTIPDLNLYYNYDQRNEFPMRCKEITLPDVDAIMALGFVRRQDYWLMAVASSFEIHFCTFSGDLENFQCVDRQVNTNGEQVHQICFFKESLIFGGDSGTLKRNGLEEKSLQRPNLAQRLYKTVKKIISDISFKSNIQQIVQIEIDHDRGLCYGLLELYNEKDNTLKSTSILIYDLGIAHDRFDYIVSIKQEDVWRMHNLTGLGISKQFYPEDLQFFHIQRIEQSDPKSPQLCITTKSQIQIKITLSNQHMDVNELQKYLEVENMNSIMAQKLVQQELGYECSFWRPVGEFTVSDMKMPLMGFKQLEQYGVCLEDAKVNCKTLPLQQIQQICNFKSILVEPNLVLSQVDNSIVARFTDPAHVAFEKGLENIQQKYAATSIYATSLFMHSQKDAVERMDLMESPQQRYALPYNQIDRLQLQQLFQLSDPSDQQMYNYPKHFTALSQSGLDFIVQLRPIDMFFMAIKATHIEFLEQCDSEMPLEKLIRAYGVEESSAIILQLMIQPDSEFFVNVALEKQFQDDICQIIHRYDSFSYHQKCFDTIETTPRWVTNELYILKGSILAQKASRAYHQVIRRNLYGCEKNQRSVKVYSCVQVMRRIIKPIYDKPFFNYRAYKLLANNSIETYSHTQLKAVHQQMTSLLALFARDQQFYYQPNSNPEDQNVQQFKRYVYGFSKQIFESFDKTVQMDQNRDTCGSYSVNIDYEHQQMKTLQLLCNQTAQLIEFLLYLFHEQQNLREILNSIQEKERLFQLRLPDVIIGDCQGKVMITQLMIHILKRETTSIKDKASYLFSKFPDYFSLQDYNITVATSQLDEIILYTFDKNLIKFDQKQSIRDKVKQLLKFTQRSQLTIDKVLETKRTYIYYKDLPQEMQNQLNETFKLIRDIVTIKDFQFIFKTFKPYMYPFSTHKYYIEYMVQKCKQLSKSQEHAKEYKDCIFHIIEEFNWIVSNTRTPPTNITVKQAFDILSECLMSLSKEPIEELFQSVANELLRNGLNDYIIELNSPFDLQLEWDELDKVLIQHKQAIQQLTESSNDPKIILTIIETAFKLASLNLSHRADLSYREIMNKLSIEHRIAHLDKVFDLIDINNKCGNAQDLSQYERQCTDLQQVLILQDILHDFIVSYTENGEDNEREKKKVVVEVLGINQIMQFFRDNHIYFAQLIGMVVSESINHRQYTPTEIEQCYCDLLFDYYQFEQWRSELMIKQLQKAFDHIIGTPYLTQKYLNLHAFITYCELINSKLQVKDNQGWVLEIMQNYTSEINILVTYLNVYNQAESVQYWINNLTHSRIEDIDVSTYQVTLAQEIVLIVQFIIHNTKNKDILIYRHDIESFFENAKCQIPEQDSDQYQEDIEMAEQAFEQFIR